MSAVLIAESDQPKPGSSILVGFQMTPRPGWHGYWSNPGDSGIAPSVHWIAPEGVSFGPLMHPAPTLLTEDGISSFVHEGPHILLSRMTVARSFAPGTQIPVRAQLSWAACTATQCVPLRTTLNLDLVVGSGRKSEDSPTLKATERQLPAKMLPATFQREGTLIRLLMPEALRLETRRVKFFPDENADFTTAEARATLDRGKLAIVGPSSSAANSISGVLSDGDRSWRIRFALAEPLREGRAAPAEDPGEEVTTAPPRAPATASATVTDSRDESQPREGSRLIWIAAVAVLAGLLIYPIIRRRK